MILLFHHPQLSLSALRSTRDLCSFLVYAVLAQPVFPLLLNTNQRLKPLILSLYDPELHLFKQSAVKFIFLRKHYLLVFLNVKFNIGLLNRN